MLKAAEKRRKSISFILLFLISALWLIPILWGLATSFKSPQRIASHPASFIPDFYLENYITLLTNPNFPVLRWMLNSFIIASLHTVLYLIVACLAAYAFACLKFKFRDALFWFLLSTTMIPTVINFVPLITMMIKINWYQTWLALIIPGLGGVFGLFLLRQFFKSIPYDIIESAQIEGMSSIGILIKIVLPLSKSAVLVAALFAFMGNWNDFLWPSVILAGLQRDMITLPVGLAMIQGDKNYELGLSMAAAMLSIMPVVVVYIFIQRYIIEGVAHTGSSI